MSNRRLVESQLGLHFTVGPADESQDSSCSKLAGDAYDAFEALLKSEGMALLGRPDPSISDDFRFQPFELCEFDWEGTEIEGMIAYGFWIHGPDFSQEEARILRDMAARAVTTVCGEDGRFVRAELYCKWEESATAPFEM